MRISTPIFRGSVVALITATVMSHIASGLPERPAIDRPVHARVTGVNPDGEPISETEMIAPHIPAFRTSGDGRIGVDLKLKGGDLRFYLVNPEGLSTHFTDPTVSFGAHDILSSVDPFRISDAHFRNLLDGINDGITRSNARVRQLTIMDQTQEFGDPTGFNGINNPVAEIFNGEIHDVYYLTVFATLQFSIDGMDHSRFQLTPIKVYVSNPKTAAAQIELVEVDDTVAPVMNSQDLIPSDILEPMVTGDGRLLVCRINERDFEWTNPNTGALEMADYVDIAYSYSADGDVEGFANLIPITFANSDARINQRYGFAMHPMRDSLGNLFPAGVDLQGSYPWIDHKGDNLFFTTISARLNDGNDARYPNVPFINGATPDNEEASSTRGHSVMGLWTHGKMVVIDNLLNNTDYGMGTRDTEHSIVTLYEANGDYDGTKRVGTGRENGAGKNAPAIDSNTAFFDSLENKMAYQDSMATLLPYDVVWQVSNGKATAEFSFDDYLNVDSFIVSNMHAALEFDPNSRRTMIHHDGWDGNGFNNPVLVGNYATALPDRWTIPTHADTHGSVRIEPIANGGISGKGLWLEGNSGLSYNIPDQTDGPSALTGADWYVGIFLDTRHPDSTAERSLLTFPDGSALHTVGRSTLLFKDATGTVLHTTALAGELGLPLAAWAHIGVQIFNGGTRVDLYHNGFLLDYYEDPANPIFRMTDGDQSDSDNNGTLYVGDVPSDGLAGFNGWIDEFKVFAHTFAPEVCANFARGTLVGFNTGDHPELETQAALYGALGQGEIEFFLNLGGQDTFDHYAVWYDYSDDMAAHLGNIPSAVSSLRNQIIFPESPLFHDASRPDSLTNPFCLSCHTPDSKQGLASSALLLDRSLTAADDTRRLPMQAPRRVFGAIPENWLNSGNSADLSNIEGSVIDTYVKQSIDPSTRSVGSLMLFDADTQQPIMNLSNDSVVDFNAIGQVNNLAIRANLDAAQGSVVFYMADDNWVYVEDAAENTAPYSLFGTDANGDLIGSEIPNSTYTFSATPFADDDGSGIQGIALVLTNVTFVNFPADPMKSTNFLSNLITHENAGWSYQKVRIDRIGNSSQHRALNLINESLDNERYSTNTGSRGFWVNTGKTNTRGNQALVAAFQAQISGIHTITDLSIDTGVSTKTIRTHVYVNDTLITSYDYTTTLNVAELSVGEVTAGDNIYVIIESVDTDGGDRHDFDFSIVY
ncbi:MAG: hypothetical protein ACPGN3_00145 [Opitutales bacterium]